jgi:hypothetical protein
MNSPKKIDDRVGYIVPGIGQAAAVRATARRCLAKPSRTSTIVSRLSRCGAGSGWADPR